MKYFAVIPRDSPRRESWLRVFGTDVVEVMEPEPHEGTMPNGRTALFYRCPSSSLTLDQVEAVVAASARRWDVPAAEIAADVQTRGFVPILANDALILIVATEKGVGT